ncbi:hypothetical protein AB0436_27955 [Streptomyces sp. NPDC051322]|uniref:hypothetical protein n=1 Tax=Streptomyces sp. NPDC051322 TaxID=3154645 RepID=UPI003450AF74
MDPIDTPEWADNPRLRAWLTTQRAAFPSWAEEHGGGWDFTPGSLDRLEERIRSSFSSWDDVRDARDSPLLSVAAWYLGEVQVRHCHAVWRCSPTPPPPGSLTGGHPVVVFPREALDEHERLALDELAEAGEYPMALVDPAGTIRSLFAAPDSHLRDAIARFEHFQRWRCSVGGGA